MSSAGINLAKLGFDVFVRYSVLIGFSMAEADKPAKKADISEEVESKCRGDAELD